MTKSDLKDGMIVRLRNGDHLFKIANRLIPRWEFGDRDSWIRIQDFKDNLIHCKHKEMDIMQVYTVFFMDFNDDLVSVIQELDSHNCRLIWERKIPTDWENVSKGTEIKVWIDNDKTVGTKRKLYLYDSNLDLPYVTLGKRGLEQWKHAELIEEE